MDTETMATPASFNACARSLVMPRPPVVTRAEAQQQGVIDDYGNPVKGNPTQEEVRAARRAKRQGGGQGPRQAKQAMKMIRRAGKL